MMKIKIIVFVDKVFAKSRKQFQSILFSDFLKNEAFFLKFIKIDKLLDQAKRRAIVLEKINNFEKNFIDH